MSFYRRAFFAHLKIQMNIFFTISVTCFSFALFPTWQCCASYLFLSSSPLLPALVFHPRPFGTYLPLPPAPLLSPVLLLKLTKVTQRKRWHSFCSRSCVSPAPTFLPPESDFWFYSTLKYRAENHVMFKASLFCLGHLIGLGDFTSLYFFFTKNVGNLATASSDCAFWKNRNTSFESFLCFASSCSPSAMQTSSFQWRLMGLFIR